MQFVNKAYKETNKNRSSYETGYSLPEAKFNAP